MLLLLLLTANLLICIVIPNTKLFVVSITQGNSALCENIDLLLLFSVLLEEPVLETDIDAIRHVKNHYASCLNTSKCSKFV